MQLRGREGWQLAKSSSRPSTKQGWSVGEGGVELTMASRLASRQRDEQEPTRVYLAPRMLANNEDETPVSYTHLTLPTTPYV